MPLRTVALTLYGQPVTGLTITIGETTLFDLYMQDPLTRAGLAPAGATMQLSIAAPDIQGNPTRPAAVSKAIVFVVGTPVGHAQATLTASDTAALVPGTYLMDVWMADTSGNRLDMMPLSPIKVLGAATV